MQLLVHVKAVWQLNEYPKLGSRSGFVNRKQQQENNNGLELTVAQLIESKPKDIQHCLIPAASKPASKMVLRGCSRFYNDRNLCFVCHPWPRVRVTYINDDVPKSAPTWADDRRMLEIQELVKARS